RRRAHRRRSSPRDAAPLRRPVVGSHARTHPPRGDRPLEGAPPPTGRGRAAIVTRRNALALYATRARQLVGRAPRDRPTAIAPPLPPGRLVTLPGRGDVFIREAEGPDGR